MNAGDMDRTNELSHQRFANFLDAVERELAAITDEEHEQAIAEILSRGGYRRTPDGMAVSEVPRQASEQSAVSSASIQIPDTPHEAPGCGYDLLDRPGDEGLSVHQDLLRRDIADLEAVKTLRLAELERVVEDARDARELADWALREADDARLEAQRVVAAAQREAEEYRDAALKRAAERLETAGKRAARGIAKADDYRRRTKCEVEDYRSRIKNEADQYHARVRAEADAYREAAIAQASALTAAAKADADDIRYVAGEFANAVVAAAASTLPESNIGRQSFGDLECVSLPLEATGSLVEVLGRLQVLTRSRDSNGLAKALDEMLASDSDGDAVWLLRHVIAAGIRAANASESAAVSLHSVAEEHERLLAGASAASFDLASAASTARLHDCGEAGRESNSGAIDSAHGSFAVWWEKSQAEDSIPEACPKRARSNPPTSPEFDAPQPSIVIRDSASQGAVDADLTANAALIRQIVETCEEGDGRVRLAAMSHRRAKSNSMTIVIVQESEEAAGSIPSPTDDHSHSIARATAVPPPRRTVRHWLFQETRSRRGSLDRSDSSQSSEMGGVRGGEDLYLRREKGWLGGHGVRKAPSRRILSVVIQTILGAIGWLVAFFGLLPLVTDLATFGVASLAIAGLSLLSHLLNSAFPALGRGGIADSSDAGTSRVVSA